MAGVYKVASTDSLLDDIEAARALMANPSMLEDQTAPLPESSSAAGVTVSF